VTNLPVWYVHYGDEQKGPLTWDQVVITYNNLSPDEMLLWKEGYPKWVPARDLIESATTKPAGPQGETNPVDPASPPDSEDAGPSISVDLGVIKRGEEQSEKSASLDLSSEKDDTPRLEFKLQENLQETPSTSEQSSAIPENAPEKVPLTPIAKTNEPPKEAAAPKPSPTNAASSSEKGSAPETPPLDNVEQHILKREKTGSPPLAITGIIIGLGIAGFFHKHENKFGPLFSGPSFTMECAIKRQVNSPTFRRKYIVSSEKFRIETLEPKPNIRIYDGKRFITFRKKTNSIQYARKTYKATPEALKKIIFWVPELTVMAEAGPKIGGQETKYRQVRIARGAVESKKEEWTEHKHGFVVKKLFETRANEKIVKRISVNCDHIHIGKVNPKMFKGP